VFFTGSYRYFPNWHSGCPQLSGVELPWPSPFFLSPFWSLWAFIPWCPSFLVKRDLPTFFPIFWCFVSLMSHSPLVVFCSLRTSGRGSLTFLLPPCECPILCPLLRNSPWSLCPVFEPLFDSVSIWWCVNPWGLSSPRLFRYVLFSSPSSFHWVHGWMVVLYTAYIFFREGPLGCSHLFGILKPGFFNSCWFLLPITWLPICLCPPWRWFLSSER